MTSIAENRKASFNYFIEERLEAGIVLEGWEVKAIRAGRAPRRLMPRVGGCRASADAPQEDACQGEPGPADA